MNFCSYIADIDNIDIQCDLKDGFENVGYIVSRSDIDYAQLKKGYTNSQTDVKYPNTVITQFALKDGKKGKYIKQLKNAFADTTVALSVGDYRNTFTNTVSFKIFGTGPHIAQIVNGLASDEFVVILQQKEKGANGESAYRVFGLDNGLTATATDNNANDESLGNGWNITMEETGAASSSYFMFISTGKDIDPTLEATEQCIATAFEQVD